MKKILTLAMLTVLLCQQLFAQPTQAEIDKMMKRAQMEIEKMKKDPKNKELIKSMPNIDSLMKNMPKGNNQAATKNIKTGTVSSTLPARNNKLLSQLPKKTFTKAELVVYCNDLYKQLADKISPAKVKAVNDIMAKPGGNAYKFNLAAVASWYNGALEEATLIAIKAAALNPEYDVLLNNTAAMLNLDGLEYKAIPILKTLLEKYPDNPMVLNNMGQAYAGLGAADTAMFYLGRCIAKSPNHPEANNTAGQIELAKGNKAKAKDYFEHSISGAYSESNSNALLSIDPEVNYSKYIRPRVHIPEYFSADKYRLPQQCENIGQAAVAKEEQDAFKEMISALIKKYEIMEKEESKIAKQTVTQKLLVGVNQNHEAMPPFFFLAGTMLAEINKGRSEDLIALDKYNQNFYENIKSLEKQYEKVQADGRAQFAEREEKQGEGNPDPELDKAICKTYEEIANRYLLLFSNLRHNWQDKNLALEKKYLNDLIYWTYLLSIDIHDFRQNFYGLVTDHLTSLNILNETKILYPCDREEVNKQKADSLQIKEPECPFEVELKFIVGTVSLDCKKFSFSGGEGFIFKYEKEFKSGQSTISLGIGAQLELGGGFGGVKVGAGASASECVFIKFDGNGHVTDGGLKFDAKAGAGAELEGAIGKNVNIKKDLSKVEAGVGYTIGMESGIKFDEGPLKNLLNPPEVPLNKNVKIYKPNQP